MINQIVTHTAQKQFARALNFQSGAVPEMPACEDEKQRLFENTARNMEGTTTLVKKRHIRHCYLADPAYGEGVAKALGISIKEIDMDDPYGARA